jgi:hypothetical protein
MIDRTEFAGELLLREQIRKAIRIISQKRALRETKERELRDIIQDLLTEAQAAVTTTAKHANTGINMLEDLLKNSNILSVLEKGYKSLTTNKEQRDSYRNHVLVAVEKSLAPEESRKEAGDTTVELEDDNSLQEDVNIDIDSPENDPDFIDVEEKEVTKPDGEKEIDEFAIEGKDLTGRNKAYTDFQTISKVILRAYDDLDDPVDLNMFEEYLIKNLSLYFDKFEAELEAVVEPPAAAADAMADVETDSAPVPPAAPPLPAGAEEEEVANIELQEIIKHLNVDDIIANLL